MARPRRDAGLVPAKERLENTFWEMLAEMPYREMTVAAISSRAEVSHNTFYYYFKNIEDMTLESMEKNFIPEFPLIALSAFEAGAPDFSQLASDPEAKKRFNRLCLLLGKNSSPWIQEILKKSVLGKVPETLGIDLAALSREEKILLTFVVGGFLSILAEHEQGSDIFEPMVLMSSDFGKAIFAAMTSLQKTA